MCAVVGLIDTTDTSGRSALAADAYQALMALQHRGQDASGMVSFERESTRFFSHKRPGLVNDVYKDALWKLKGQGLIGHNRYPTIGTNGEWDIQPMLSGFPIGMALAHNGNTLNVHELKAKLQRERKVQSLTGNDLECFLHLYSLFITEAPTFNKDGVTYDLLANVSRKVVDAVNGSYALVGLIANLGLFGLRDPHGIRPLVLGERKGRYCLTSETGGLDLANFKFIRDIRPGEFIFIDFEGNVNSTILKEGQRRHCMFEWVYFAGTESIIERSPVYQGRLELGKRLGEQVKKLIHRGEIRPDLVAPVPDTGRTAAMSLSEVTNLPYRECLIKNRYVQRSFILNSQKVRDEIVQRKLVPIRSEIEGRNILLVDDSIVRGTTSRRVVSLLREYGVNKVYFASTCPPIRHSCFYGIDFPSSSELIAGAHLKNGLDDIDIGADKVIYLSVEDLNESLLKDKMCMGCLTGHYPTNIEQAKNFSAMRTKERMI